MVEFAAHLVVSAALLLVVAYAIRGIEVDGALAALFGALVLGLANAFVRPVLVVLSLPITVLTLGLFLIVVNAFMLKLAAALVPGFRIDSFLPAVWGALFLSLLNLLVAHVTGPGWAL
ncbi:MAG: phage holin family protein [Deltaproteobacteria bacterium]|nr:phage holin family protein [Deltaproteobacteria bacterium]MBW2444299.1 phage holin family protein [Deltaproteobacteria bacterium]